MRLRLDHPDQFGTATGRAKGPTVPTSPRGTPVRYLRWPFVPGDGMRDRLFEA